MFLPRYHNHLTSHAFAIAIALCAPLVLYAQQTLAEIIQRFIDLILFALPLLVTLTLLVFIWGLARFILNPESEQERTKAKTIMIWGVFMLFLMVSVWGIVAIIQNTFFF